MKRLPARRRRKSVTPGDHAGRPDCQEQDRMALIAFLITGVVLVSAYHYSLENLSAFYGLIIAAQAAGRSRYFG